MGEIKNALSNAKQIRTAQKKLYKKSQGTIPVIKQARSPAQKDAGVYEDFSMNEFGEIIRKGR